MKSDPLLLAVRAGSRSPAPHCRLAARPIHHPPPAAPRLPTRHRSSPHATRAPLPVPSAPSHADDGRAVYFYAATRRRRRLWHGRRGMCAAPAAARLQYKQVASDAPCRRTLPTHRCRRTARAARPRAAVTHWEPAPSADRLPNTCLDGSELTTPADGSCSDCASDERHTAVCIM